jgi:hypothetical protein
MRKAGLLSINCFCGGAACCCSGTRGAAAKKILRIGFLSSTGDLRNPGPSVEVFREGLHSKADWPNDSAECARARGQGDQMRVFQA